MRDGRRSGADDGGRERDRVDGAGAGCRWPSRAGGRPAGDGGRACHRRTSVTVAGWRRPRRSRAARRRHAVCDRIMSATLTAIDAAATSGWTRGGAGAMVTWFGGSDSRARPTCSRRRRDRGRQVEPAQCPRGRDREPAPRRPTTGQPVAWVPADSAPRWPRCSSGSASTRPRTRRNAWGPSPSSTCPTSTRSRRSTRACRRAAAARRRRRMGHRSREVQRPALHAEYLRRGSRDWLARS